MDSHESPASRSSGGYRERADAARNRERILKVAQDLFEQKGARNVSMEEIAQSAGVGKGTVYRRFHDQAGLALAVLEEKERRLQETVIRGAPPLGPGGSPKERLIAFLHALLDLLEEHTELHLVSETASPGARYRSGLYKFYRLHVEVLLEQIDDRLDRELLSGMIMAMLSAELFRHWRTEKGLSLERIKAGVTFIAEQMFGPQRKV